MFVEKKFLKELKSRLLEAANVTKTHSLSPEEWEVYRKRKDEIEKIEERIEEVGGTGGDRGVGNGESLGTPSPLAGEGGGEGTRFAQLLSSFEKFNEAAIQRRQRFPRQ